MDLNFTFLEQMIPAAFEAVRPAEQLTVAEAAERYHIVRRPGAHSGPFSNEKTPYLREPMEVLNSLDYTAMVFAGPARAGKSVMAINWLSHTAVTNPNDMMFIHMTQATAREWSLDDLAKALRDSPELRRRLRPGRQNDNVHDKSFMSGMRLQIKWPSITELSGKTIPYQWVFDLDRIPDDIDGEGALFDLLKKRGQTFGRYAMTGAESSPGREVDNVKHIPKTPHEAPPTKGILGLYNRGDRRRWYWRCVQCHDAFEPSFSLLKYPDSIDIMERAEQVYLECPCCGFPTEPSFKEELNAGGKWVRDGMLLLPSGDIVQRPGMREVRSDIASFWLQGPAAAFQPWKSLVLNYLRAEEAFEATGDEGPLQTTVNLDQGLPYTPKNRLSERLPEDLKTKAEDWGATSEHRTIPPDVRFLVATVDVQAGGNASFVVQVQGFGPGGDMIVVDGFKLTKSRRRDEDDDVLRIDPAAFAEDWDILIDQVIERTYELNDGSGRRMQIKMVGCDSGGAEGVTLNAYSFWRRLKADERGYHRRFALVKGGTRPSDPSTSIIWPDSNKKDPYAVSRGDVPVILFNPNLLKDQVANMLGRRVAEATEIVGGGSIRYPTWFPDWFYTQMTTEIRTTKGWENPARRRNEAFDLAYYALGVALRPNDITTQAPLGVIRYHKIDWYGEDCPGWAKPWDQNDLIIEKEAPLAFARVQKPKRSLADLAAELT